MTKFWCMDVDIDARKSMEAEISHRMEKVSKVLWDLRGVWRKGQKKWKGLRGLSRQLFCMAMKHGLLVQGQGIKHMCWK